MVNRKRKSPFILIESMLAAFVIALVISGLVGVLIVKQMDTRRMVLESKAGFILQAELARIRVTKSVGKSGNGEEVKFTPSQTVPPILSAWTWTKTVKPLTKGVFQVGLAGSAPGGSGWSARREGVVYE